MEIRESDALCVDKTMKKLFGDTQYKIVSRLNGMTNRSYRVDQGDGLEYVVRIPGEGTEELIDRRDEKKSTILACKLGIDAELISFDNNGIKVMRFIPHNQSMDEATMQKDVNITRAADILRKLHRCGESTGVRFEVFDMAEDYERLINRHHVRLYDDYAEVRHVIMEIKHQADAEGETKKVPCHNDVLMGNWVLSRDERLYLIDWEYAGMNDPMWDLACLSIEAAYDDEMDAKLLLDYFGHEVSVYEKKMFMANKLYVDYLWTLWGKTRVPYDAINMETYAASRYSRLKRNIESFRTMITG